MGTIKFAALAAALAISAPAFAQNFDPGSLRSMGVKTAQLTLAQNGFTHARNINVSGKQYDLWRTNNFCVGFTSFNGTVTDAKGFDNKDCGPVATPPPPGRPPRNFDINQIKGQPVGASQSVLSRSGFSKARNINVDGKQWDLWRGQGSCVGFTSYYGNITEVRSFSERECRDDNSGGGGGGYGNRRDYNERVLQGLSVGNGQSRLRNDGFSPAGRLNIDDEKWDLWWNDDYRDSCIGFTSYNGRINATDEFSNNRCNSDNYGGGNNYNNGGNNYGGSNRSFNTRQLENQPVGTTQSILRTGGYSKSRNYTVDGQQWDLWYNPSFRNSCIAFTSYNGRVTGVREFRERDCTEGLR